MEPLQNAAPFSIACIASVFGLSTIWPQGGGKYNKRRNKPTRDS